MQKSKHLLLSIIPIYRVTSLFHCFRFRIVFSNESLVLKWAQWLAADLPSDVLWSHGAAAPGKCCELGTGYIWHGHNPQGFCFVPVDYLPYKSSSVYCVLYNNEGLCHFFLAVLVSLTVYSFFYTMHFFCLLLEWGSVSDNHSFLITGDKRLIQKLIWLFTLAVATQWTIVATASCVPDFVSLGMGSCHFLLPATHDHLGTYSSTQSPVQPGVCAPTLLWHSWHLALFICRSHVLWVYGEYGRFVFSSVFIWFLLIG